LKSNMQIAYIADIFVFYLLNRDAPAERFLAYARGSGGLLQKHFFSFAIWRVSILFFIKNFAGIVIYLFNNEKRKKHWFRILGFYQGFTRKLRP
ncbi:MAG: hypothetical protein R3182_11310, partial [Draconibacterium sp.]|nr:hypothetical protein [Draconibacterium sp.]